MSVIDSACDIITGLDERIEHLEAVNAKLVEELAGGKDIGYRNGVKDTLRRVMEIVNNYELTIGQVRHRIAKLAKEGDK